ncbi:MAG: fibronectin type III domain-containing protein [Defluviitaleaceae bacterium]|nr:fibronectin type III domain-containing protein [Defluviitaleaceae bacterium]
MSKKQRIFKKVILFAITAVMLTGLMPFGLFKPQTAFAVNSQTALQIIANTGGKITQNGTVAVAGTVINNGKIDGIDDVLTPHATVTATATGWVYDGTNTKTVISNVTVNGTATTDYTVTYRARNAADSTATSTVPTNAGNYTAIIILNASHTHVGTGYADFTIEKAEGAAVSGAPALSINTSLSITVTAVTSMDTTKNPNVQYAISTVNNALASELSWGSVRAWTGLTPNTTYYAYARTQETANYTAGQMQVSEAITTDKPSLINRPTIDGEAKFGETLTANTDTIYANPSVGTLVFDYQWNRSDEPIVGATSGTYTLVAADMGHTITVSVSTPLTEQIRTSDPTATVTCDHDYNEAENCMLCINCGTIRTPICNDTCVACNCSHTPKADDCTACENCTTTLGEHIPKAANCTECENCSATLTASCGNICNFCNPQITVPGAPTNISSTAGDEQATVFFAPPVNDGGSKITDYTVTAIPGGISATGTSSPIIVPGLTNGTAYTFTVTATNSVGTGAASDASNSVTPMFHVPPTGVPAIAGSVIAMLMFLGISVISWGFIIRRKLIRRNLESVLLHTNQHGGKTRA